jgi:hypothetical protein
VPVTELPSVGVQRGTGADPLDSRARADLDPGALEDRREHGSGLGLLPGEDPVRGLDDGHPRAELREGLRELDADRAATHHQQVLRLLGQVEQRPVVEVRNRVQPVDRRDAGVRARREHHPRAAHDLPVHVERVRGGQARPSTDEVDPLRLQLLGRLVRGDAVDDVVHVPHHRGEVDVAHRAEPPLLRLPGTGHPVRHVEQRLAGDAAVVRAVPSGLGLVDQGDAAAGHAGGARGGEASRTRSEDDQVVPAHRRSSSSSARCIGCPPYWRSGATDVAAGQSRPR